MIGNERDHQEGFTLVEALVALVVLAIGLVSLVALQGTSVRLNQKNQKAEVGKQILVSEIDKIIPLSNLQLRQATVQTQNYVGQTATLTSLGSPFTDTGSPFQSTANTITVDTAVPSGFDYVRWRGVQRVLVADEKGATGQSFSYLVKISIDEKFLQQDILARGRITVYWPAAKRGLDFLETTFFIQRK